MPDLLLWYCIAMVLFGRWGILTCWRISIITVGKDSDAGRDWGQEEKGTTEDEMAGWHHGLDGRESEWTPGDGDGQGGLACCDSWGCKELDTTEQLNWTELNWTEQLDQFCRKQEKWVEVTYMFLFISLKDIPDLCPKGADLVCETFNSLLSSYFAPWIWGSRLNTLRVRAPFQEELPLFW